MGHRRHTYATEMLLAGVTLPSLMKLLGRSSADMTMHYLKITLPDVQREFHLALAAPDISHRTRNRQQPLWVPICQDFLNRYVRHSMSWKCFAAHCRTAVPAGAWAALPTASPRSSPKDSNSHHLRNRQRLAGYAEYCGKGLAPVRWDFCAAAPNLIFSAAALCWNGTDGSTGVVDLSGIDRLGNIILRHPGNVSAGGGGRETRIERPRNSDFEAPLQRLRPIWSEIRYLYPWIGAVCEVLWKIPRMSAPSHRRGRSFGARLCQLDCRVKHKEGASPGTGESKSREGF
jgi:hypothetical protein